MYKTSMSKKSTTSIGEYDEIKDFLDVNSTDDIAKYIYNLEKECDRLQKGLKTAREMLSNRVTKDRYNDLVKKYNKAIKNNK